MHSDLRIKLKFDFARQVLKVCANHYILPNMTVPNYKSEKEQKVLAWTALDFTDGEGVVESFCCRFKTEDLANDFKVCSNMGHVPKKQLASKIFVVVIPKEGFCGRGPANRSFCMRTIKILEEDFLSSV